jgi:hypothetical protein
MKKHIGKCIYCFSSLGELTDEHVIPHGLLIKGQEPIVLENASCEICQNIINKVETDVLRKLLKLARSFLGFKTYNKSHPEEFLANVDGMQKTLSVKDLGAWIMLPVFEKPHFGTKKERGIFIVGSTLIKSGGTDINRLTKTLGAKSIGVTFKFDPTKFARTLAKIAYGFSIYQYGLERFEKSLLNDIILGTDLSPGKWIGSIDRKVSEETYIGIRTGIVKGNQILCHISLFERWGGPTYVICVGVAKAKK